MSSVGLRVAVVGNGGAGKSMISGTLARLLARRGRKVLAVDLDPNPGLAWSLGSEPTDAGLPDEFIAEVPKGLYGWGLAPDVNSIDILERVATESPDGVRYLSPGKIDRPNHLVSHSLGAVRQIVGEADSSWDVIGDLEAGTTTPYEGYSSFAQRLVLVVTPAWKSALAARRLAGLFPGLPYIVVASKFTGESDHEGLAPDVRIPFDRDVADAERRGLAPLDACPDSPVIGAIETLAGLLVREEVRL